MGATHRYIYRSHSVAIIPLPSGRFAFQIDGDSPGQHSQHSSDLAASVAADSAIDVLIEDGPAAVGDMRLPGMECADA